MPTATPKPPLQIASRPAPLAAAGARPRRLRPERRACENPPVSVRA